MNLSLFSFGAAPPSQNHARPDKGQGAETDPYEIGAARRWLYRIACATPPAVRETLAEAFLRRPEAPGPAAEHAFQAALGARLAGGARSGKAATVAKAADSFYAHQYRQALNPQMGAFAATATQAVLGAGRLPRGALWRRRRQVEMAMAETVADAPPILVLDHESVAIPLYLPVAVNLTEWRPMARWLEGGGAPPPASVRRLMLGDRMRCVEAGACARRRPAAGALLAVADAALRSRKLAILALHPFDPDAMGLHVTLFGVEAVTPQTLIRDHGLEGDALTPWLCAAGRLGEKLLFLVGGVEEAFTQCSQNLFVKRPAEAASRRAAQRLAWAPCDPLDSLVGGQFEIFQATVSASGLPGVSPRNGEIGRAGFVVRRGRRSFVLIPYFTGNGVHGHAAKLWSNPWSSLIIRDDHTTGSVVTLSGPTRIAPHSWIVAHFPAAAASIARRRRRNGAPADDPEYWFAQRVVDISLQDEAAPLTRLDPARGSCTLHAAGPAHHGKKPTYFAADSLAAYDMRWQHRREARGRPRDPSGRSRRDWLNEAEPALHARLSHLARSAVVDVLEQGR